MRYAAFEGDRDLVHSSFEPRTSGGKSIIQPGHSFGHREP